MTRIRLGRRRLFCARFNQFDRNNGQHERFRANNDQFRAKLVVINITLRQNTPNLGSQTQIKG